MVIIRHFFAEIKSIIGSFRDKTLANLGMIFIVLAFGAGISMPIITPLNQVPDEASHIARAAALGHGAIFGQVRLIHAGDGSTYRYSGLKINAGLAKAMHSETNFIPNIAVPTYPSLNKSEYLSSRHAKWSKHRVFVSCPNSLQYFPAMYIPGTIGIYFGRLIGFSPFYSLIIGRIFMLMAYIAMGYSAIRIARYGRGILFACLLMPMPLNLAGSFNQDAQILASCALACAMLTTGEDKMRRWAAFILMLVMCSKPPYGLLLIVLLFPLSSPGLIRRIGLAVISGLPAVLWYAASKVIDLVPFWTVQFYLPGPWWTGQDRLMHLQSTTRNLHVLLQEPTRFFTLPWHMLSHNLFAYVLEGIAWFGQNSLMAPPLFYIAWIVAIFFAFMSCAMSYNNKKILEVKIIDQITLFSFIIISIWVLILAIYISWAMTGAVTATGVTGRYFILFIPFAMIGIPRIGNALDRFVPSLGGASGLEFMMIIPAIIMGFIDAVYLPGFVASHFYLIK